jgi:hypothetical protein
MKRISFNPRFVNEAGNGLVEGKIHTIRRSFDFWKKFEGQDVALFTWEGVPYRSKQRVFCVKLIVNVQGVYKRGRNFYLDDGCPDSGLYLPTDILAEFDGFKAKDEFLDWFVKYPDEEMAILHFTEFRY